MTGRGRARIAALLAAGLAVAPEVAATPAAAAPPAPGCARPTGVYGGGEPWAQRALDPGAVWPLTTGTGVLVAVLGTGVDPANAQFATGQVAAGTDVAHTGRPATVDCDGRGTFAAGIIAARADPRTTFAGMAPGVRILPVRYVQALRGGTGAVNPDLIASAITTAVRAGARVLCVLVPSTVDSQKLRAAVAAARQADALVVSPATAAPAGQDGGAGRSYPTSEQGVLAVGAVDQSGAPVAGESGPYLAVAAPGRALVSTAAGANGSLGHLGPIDDASFAAAYVAGTAALVRAYRPQLTAAQVVARLERTAYRPAGGRDPRLGYGMVNPYAAVASEGVDGTAVAAPAPAPASRVAAATPAAPRRTGRTAAVAALAGVILAVLLAGAAVVMRRGRARGWRSGAGPDPSSPVGV